jgi:hypothetical protein
MCGAQGDGITNKEKNLINWLSEGSALDRHRVEFLTAGSKSHGKPDAIDAAANSILVQRCVQTLGGLPSPCIHGVTAMTGKINKKIVFSELINMLLDG